MSVLIITVSIEQDEPFPDDAEIDDLARRIESFAVNAYASMETSADLSLGCDWLEEGR